MSTASVQFFIDDGERIETGMHRNRTGGTIHTLHIGGSGRDDPGGTVTFPSELYMRTLQEAMAEALGRVETRAEPDRTPPDEKILDTGASPNTDTKKTPAGNTFAHVSLNHGDRVRVPAGRAGEDTGVEIMLDLDAGISCSVRKLRDLEREIRTAPGQTSN